MSLKIAILGCGNIGSIFARELLHKSLVSRESLIIIERDAVKREALSRELGCQVVEMPDSKLENADILLLAIKPQEWQEASALVKDLIPSTCVVLSVMAGIRLEKLRTVFQKARHLVRCMPNTPSRLGLGMTVYCSAEILDQVTEARMSLVLSSVGLALRVDREELIDAATAVSATGPAYVFYFMEQITKAALELGFSEEQAKMLVQQTFVGASELARQSSDSLTTLRKAVTSKGGTTEAAMLEFENSKVGAAIVRGVVRACERAKELGK